jgi:hypothetical protein
MGEDGERPPGALSHVWSITPPARVLIDRSASRVRASLWGGHTGMPVKGPATTAEDARVSGLDSPVLIEGTSTSLNAVGSATAGASKALSVPARRRRRGQGRAAARERRARGRTSCERVARDARGVSPVAQHPIAGTLISGSRYGSNGSTEGPGAGTLLQGSGSGTAAASRLKPA